MVCLLSSWEAEAQRWLGGQVRAFEQKLIQRIPCRVSVKAPCYGPALRKTFSKHETVLRNWIREACLAHMHIHRCLHTHECLGMSCDAMCSFWRRPVHLTFCNQECSGMWGVPAPDHIWKRWSKCCRCWAQKGNQIELQNNKQAYSRVYQSVKYTIMTNSHRENRKKKECDLGIFRATRSSHCKSLKRACSGYKGETGPCPGLAKSHTQSWFLSTWASIQSFTTWANNYHSFLCNNASRIIETPNRTHCKHSWGRKG